MRSILVGVVAALCAGSAAADGTIGSWSVTEKNAALTGKPTVVAEVDSNEQLVNQIGAPERASLIMRCQDGAMALYVAWPQVLSHDSDSILLSMPQTLVRYKVDDGPIKTDFWVMNDGRTAAGSFDNLGAPKLAKGLLGAHRLVVRMGGESAQDATFQIDGVTDVAQRVVQACLGSSLPPLSSHPVQAMSADPPPPNPTKAAEAARQQSPVVLGTMFIDVPPSLGVGLGRPGLKGAFIAGVAPNSVAEKAGVQVGDIVLTYDGKPIGGRDDLVAAVHESKLGAQVPVGLIRGTKELQLTVTY